jgi:hypothetical protein
LPVSSVVLKGSSAIENALESRKQASRTHLSRYVVKAARQAARSKDPLAIAQDVRHVATVHSAVWPEAKTPGDGAQVAVNIAILGV